MSFSTSRVLIKNSKSFLTIKYYTFIDKILKRYSIFYGWGKKKSGLKAIELSKKHHTSYVLLEDGFIRSVGLGVENAPSFSIVEDDMGIYYDATTPSKLECILNTYDFNSDNALMHTVKEAIQLILQHHISKYNNAPNIDDDFFSDYGKKKVLIIAQTYGDASLEYGLGQVYSTKDMIDDALSNNPQASVYIKIHPDVLTGKKKSDIRLDEIPSECIVLESDVNPISLLKHFDKVYTKTSGMGMEALLLGLEVHCYGVPYYAGWGLTVDKQICDRRSRKLTVEVLFAGAYILYTRYYNPYSQKKSDIIDTIHTIIKYRDLSRQNDGNLYFFGFSRWKRKNVKHFFPALSKNNIYFCNTLDDALAKGLNNESKIYVWGKKLFAALETYANEYNIPLYRVEDGFIRSVSLGSDLTKAYSLVVDREGIYFDATSASDLEILLNQHIFDERLLDRAKKLQNYLVDKKLSKYNAHKDVQIELTHKKKNQTLVLVVGQVEDDASIAYGGWGMRNSELLHEVRLAKPDAYIVYKPHPDVVVGNRVGKVDKSVALKYADDVLIDVSLPSIMDICDELHTISSLSGFEALLRGKTVYTYGMPFYAGWGLTIDKRTEARRKRDVTLFELLGGAYILYPRYINPDTNRLCEIEVLLEKIEREKLKYNSHTWHKFYIDSKNYISRKIQWVIKIVLR